MDNVYAFIYILYIYIFMTISNKIKAPKIDLAHFVNSDWLEFLMFKVMSYVFWDRVKPMTKNNNKLERSKT